MFSNCWRQTRWINKRDEKTKGNGLSGWDFWMGAAYNGNQRTENLYFEGRSLGWVFFKEVFWKNNKKEKHFEHLSVWVEKSGACDYWTGADQGPADGCRERDIYLELHSSRLWGGVRYCSRAWQGQEGMRGRDGGWWVWNRDRGLPSGSRGAYPTGAQRGDGEADISRFLLCANAQYADV